MSEPVTIGLLTVSDRASSGDYEDRSGALMAKILAQNTPWQITKQAVVPDETDLIVTTLLNWCDQKVSLILTSGGTGFAPRDITPEATRQIIERDAPGISEALRAESLKVTRHAMLSRGISGIREQTLIINLPGSPKAVRENIEVLLPILPHALQLLAGVPSSDRDHKSV